MKTRMIALEIVVDDGLETCCGSACDFLILAKEPEGGAYCELEEDENALLPIYGYGRDVWERCAKCLRCDNAFASRAKERTTCANTDNTDTRYREERQAQIAEHRACCGSEHDPEKGKLHGYCVVCGVPWPCEYAGPLPNGLWKSAYDRAVDDIAWLRNVREVQSSQLRESARAFGQILSFLRGAQEEVLNGAAGVIGYRAFLDTGMTAYLWDLADQQERKINAVLQPNISREPPKVGSTRGLGDF